MKFMEWLRNQSHDKVIDILTHWDQDNIDAPDGVVLDNNDIRIVTSYAKDVQQWDKQLHELEYITNQLSCINDHTSNILKMCKSISKALEINIASVNPFGPSRFTSLNMYCLYFARWALQFRWSSHILGYIDAQASWIMLNPSASYKTHQLLMARISQFADSSLFSKFSQFKREVESTQQVVSRETLCDLRFPVTFYVRHNKQDIVLPFKGGPLKDVFEKLPKFAKGSTKYWAIVMRTLVLDAEGCQPPYWKFTLEKRWRD